MGRFLRKWGLTIALCGGVFLLGIVFGAGNLLSEGVSSLLGAAVGAAITVGGSYWVIGANEGHRTEQFEKLVKDNVAFILDKTRSTKTFLDEAAAHAFADHPVAECAQQVRDELGALLDSAALLEQSSPFSQISDYKSRMALQKLEQLIITEKPNIEKERRWLEEHETVGVLESAVKNVGYSAERLIVAADAALSELSR